MLKADKRKMTTRPELLRREVDVLKDLTHSYIPKVYDFFVENDTVYTVMDYIEGESLDKPLKRGEHFTQAQVIEWARQLLEALIYRTSDAGIIAELPADGSALSQIRYIDSDTVIYAADGAVKAYSINSAQELWNGEPATYISVSDDGTRAACVYRDNSYAVLYDTASGEETARADFRGRKQAVARNDIFIDPGRMVFDLNNDGSRLAVSFADGSLSVFSFDGSGEMILTDPGSGYETFSGGFCSDVFAFSASGKNGAAFSMADCAKGVLTAEQQTRQLVIRGT